MVVLRGAHSLTLMSLRRALLNTHIGAEISTCTVVLVFKLLDDFQPCTPLP